ncbi:MAG: Crp/Fnr family transcriptional regulator [Bacilli bacterium]|nr:Crp/Fnr family transcriptional regulator [Bacilli bacterium]
MTKPFENISEKNKQKLFNMFHTDIITYKAGEDLSNMLLDKNSIGIIIEGYIQIIKENLNGSKIVIDELYEDDVLSIKTIYVQDSEYEVLVKEQTKIVFFDLEALSTYPNNEKGYYNMFIKNLFLILNDKINEKNERIQILSKKTIRNRLLEYFSIVKVKNGSNNIYLPFSFMALADYLGVDRSAMSRELSYLKEEGFIEIKGKRIKLTF